MSQYEVETYLDLTIEDYMRVYSQLDTEQLERLEAALQALLQERSRGEEQ